MWTDAWLCEPEASSKGESRLKRRHTKSGGKDGEDRNFAVNCHEEAFVQSICSVEWQIKPLVI